MPRTVMTPSLPRWCDAALLVLAATVVFAWFQPGHLILAEDISIPYTPAQWRAAVEGWDPQMNTGTDYHVSEYPGLLFHHGLAATLRGIGLPVTVAQQLQFFIWFLLPGLTMYALMGLYAKGQGARAARLGAALFYMFNLHLEPVWLLKDIATLSAYATLPLSLRWFIEGCAQPATRRRNLALLGLSFLIGSGAGINPPIQLVAGAVLPLYLLWHLATARRRGLSLALPGTLPFAAATGLIWLGINAFWLVPFAVKMACYAGPMLHDAQTISLGWLQGISQHTGFMNVIRFQGHWTWYDGWQEPYHTYAAIYRTHSGLLALSWFAPLLVVLGMLAPRHPHQSYYLLLTLLGIVFGMGTHFPFQGSYLWCVKHVPLFWTLRGPYYKFGLMATLGYAWFIGFMTQQGYQWARRCGSAPLAVGLVAGMMALHMLYAFPVTAGKMYATAAERRFLPPNHVQVPSYVWRASAWFDATVKPTGARVLTLPDVETWFYSWGLAAGRPALSQVGLTSVLFRAPNPLVSTVEQPLLRAWYDALYEGTTPELMQVTRLLNVKYLLHEADLKYWVPSQDTDDPPFIRACLARQSGVTLERSFGPWDVYRVPTPLPMVYTVPTATLIAGEPADLVSIAAAAPLSDAPAFVFSSDVNPQRLAAWSREGRFDEVVFTPGVSLPDEVVLPRSVYVLVTPSRLRRVLNRSKAAPLSWTQGFDEPIPGLDGRQWRDLAANGDRVVTIQHDAPSSTVVGLGGTVKGYGMRRDLYIYWNMRLAQVVPIEPNVATTVLVYPLTLQPGENTVGFYAPETRTRLVDGREVNFRFADDWAYGPVTYQGTVYIPQSGSWKATLARGPSTAASTPPVLKIGGSPCTWQATSSRCTSMLSLTAGTTDVAMDNLRGTGDAVWLTPKNDTASSVRTLRPVESTLAGATTYHVEPIAGPGFLVVSQGFHPAWKARQGEDTLEHFPMQGFANGFWVPAAGAAAPITVRFALQRWFDRGVLCSVVTALALIALFLAGVRRRPTQRSRIDKPRSAL